MGKELFYQVQEKYRPFIEHIDSKRHTITTPFLLWDNGDITNTLPPRSNPSQREIIKHQDIIERWKIFQNAVRSITNPFTPFKSSYLKPHIDDMITEGIALRRYFKDSLSGIMLPKEIVNIYPEEYCYTVSEDDLSVSYTTWQPPLKKICATKISMREGDICIFPVKITLQPHRGNTRTLCMDIIKPMKHSLYQV